MRSYPRNSPEAAARIVALVLIADGHVGRSELEALQRLRLEAELGLVPGAFSSIVHTLCEDLLVGAYAGGSLMCSLDEATLAALLAEVEDADLQARVLRLAGAAAEADAHLADAEAMLVAMARRQWRLAEDPASARGGSPVLQPA